MFPTIPGYTIERELGQGAMGVVYLATQQGSGRAVAVKVLRPSPGAREQERLSRFEREVRVLRQLDHPHIIGLLDFGHADNDGVMPFLVMEYLPGVATLDLVVQTKPLDLPWVLDCMDELLQALDYLHTRSVPLIHRDVKPQNLGVADDGRLILLDFGLVSMQGESQLTRLDAPLGTLAYAAPEQLDSPHAVDARCDLYAAGMVFLHLLTGVNPLQDMSVTDVFNLLLVRRVSPLEAIRSGHLKATLPPLPLDVMVLLTKLLANHPSARCRSAREALEALHRYRPLSVPLGVESQELVGRDTVLQRLHTLVEQAADGAGQGVVLWGRRGGGKTRLLEELATLAHAMEVIWASSVAELAAALGVAAETTSVVAELGAQARTRPWLVCLDVPAMDEPLLDLLRRGSRAARGKRYLLAVASPVRVSAADVLTIEVGALTDEASRELACRRLGSDRSDLVDAVVRLGRHHAATIVELCDAYRRAPAADIEVSARNYYSEKMGACPAEMQRRLRVAAILGAAFEPDLLATISGSPVDAGGLDRFLFATDEGRLSFRSPAMAQAAAATGDAARAARRAALSWLESSSVPDKVERLVDLLVPLLQVEADPDLQNRLAVLTLDEVRRCVTHWQLSAGYKLLSRVYDLLNPDQPETVVAGAYLCTLAQLMGQVGEARYLLAPVAAKVDALPVELRGEAMLWLGRTWMAFSDLSQASDMIYAARAALVPDQVELWFRAHLILAQIVYNGGSHIPLPEALSCLDICLEIGRSGRVVQRLHLLALSTKMDILRMVGRYADAEVVVEEAQRLPMSPELRATWTGYQALLAIWHREDSVEGMRLTEAALHERVYWPQAINIGLIYVWQGRFVAAEERLEVAHRLAISEGSEEIEARAVMMKGTSLFYQWRFSEAEATLTECLTRRHPNVENRHDALLHQAFIRIDGGRFEEASELLDQCEAMGRGQKPIYRWEKLWAQSLLALARGDEDSARTRVAELEEVQLLDLSRPVYREAMRAGILARIAALDGQWDEFIDETERSRRLLGRLTWHASRARMVAEAAQTVLALPAIPANIIAFVATCVADAIRDMAESPTAVEALESLLRALETLSGPASSDTLAMSITTSEMAPDEALPERIGPYRVVSRLGTGGMATVYQVENEQGQSFALKLPLDTIRKEKEFRRRFMREVSLARTLQHPNLVGVVDVSDGVADGSNPYFVMEWLRGQSLEDVLTPGRSESVPNVVGLAVQVLEALVYIHQHDVVHRDIKPGNLMISDTGFVRLMDFGIARATDGTRLTWTAESLGTPHYMAPEQIAAQPVDARADIYSLGVILYEMLAGARPFPDTTWLRLSRMKMERDPPLLSGVCPGLEPRLARGVMYMLARRPEDRFQTAREALRELRRVAPEAKLCVFGD